MTSLPGCIFVCVTSTGFKCIWTVHESKISPIDGGLCILLFQIQSNSNYANNDANSIFTYTL